MSKQTAVDILYKFLYEMESFEGFDPYDFNQEEVFAKAKAIEKEQITDAYLKGYLEEIQNPLASHYYKDMAEDYYKETFKSE